MEVFIAIVAGMLLLSGIAYSIFWYYQQVLREAKNYERGLKMVPLRIYLPPSSDDIEGGGRDSRDVTEEAISQAQAMYSIIASTATKGFKSSVYGQRHIAFEIIASKGLIHYYVVVPLVLEDVVRQAVVAAYPTARLEQVEEQNVFSKMGKISGTIGGELILKKPYTFPIATFQETKRDAMQSLLNALSTLSHEDGAAVQMLVRPAPENWSKKALREAREIRSGNKKDNDLSELFKIKKVLQAFWKPPESNEKDRDGSGHLLSSVDQAKIEAIEEKTKHPGYQTMLRVVASSNTSSRSQAVLKNVVAAFSLFESASRNGLKFVPAKNIEAFTTSFIFRFFPQGSTRLILNSVELATIFHLPDQKHTQTSQLQRQMSKQVDGPYQTLEEGFLLGYNVFRGVKKQIRLGQIDRRRHTYIIGQTGTGKSKLMENLALQDMLDGKGFAFVDPHGDSAEELLGMVPKERVEDVIYFNPGDMDNPIGLNLFEFDSKDQRDFLVQEAIAMLYRLYDPGHTGIIGPRYEHWFRNAALTIMSDPAGTSFIDIPQVFNDNDFAKAKLKHVTDQTVLDFWNKEMAQTSDYHKSEVLGWFVSKFGAFLSNEMMRNVIGQTKSGFNLRDIMDNKKILLVNLSKGKTGELNSQLLGMIFVMKFQAAAMGRANLPEDQREDFTLYVDEFQNFATDSFETILSEARKYRLNLVLANQFMTQLTDKIREAIIGNVGTIVSGRIGVTDAELMVKKFSPVFDTEDLTKLPNFETVASVMINNVPSSPFSMSLIPPLGRSNPQLADALRRLSAAKYGRPRADVEKDIFKRLRSGDEEKKMRQQKALESFSQRMGAKSPAGAVAKPAGAGPSSAKPSGGASFLDEWLAKRRTDKKLNVVPPPVPSKQPAIASPAPKVAAPSQTAAATRPQPAPASAQAAAAVSPQVAQPPAPAAAAANPAPQNAATDDAWDKQFDPAVAAKVSYQTAGITAQAATQGMQVPQQNFSTAGFSGVDYKIAGQVPAAATMQDIHQMEESVMASQRAMAERLREQEASELAAARAQAQPQQQSDNRELKIQQMAGEGQEVPGQGTGESDVQEIDIDIRGNLHVVADGAASDSRPASN